METFQIRLRKALDIRNVKAINLAKAINVDRSTITFWLNGKTTARQDKIYQVAKFLNIDPSWLLGANVPFDTFENAMQVSSSKDINDQIMDKVLKLSDENKRIVYGYIDGLLQQQNNQ